MSYGQNDGSAKSNKMILFLLLMLGVLVVAGGLIAKGFIPSISWKGLSFEKVPPDHDQKPGNATFIAELRPGEEESTVKLTFFELRQGGDPTEKGNVTIHLDKKNAKKEEKISLPGSGRFQCQLVTSSNVTTEKGLKVSMEGKSTQTHTLNVGEKYVYGIHDSTAGQTFRQGQEYVHKFSPYLQGQQGSDCSPGKFDLVRLVTEIESGPTQTIEPTGKPVDIIVQAKLVAPLVSESIKFTIYQKTFQLDLSQSKPAGSVIITFPSAGKHEVKINATATITTGPGQSITSIGTGSVSMEVKGGEIGSYDRNAVSPLAYECAIFKIK